MNKKINIVLHGGLGNQLFQFFRALIIFIENPNHKIFFIEYFLSKYSVPRKYELDPIVQKLFFCHKTKIPNFLIRIRIAKIIKKFFLNKDFIFSTLNSNIVVDGYFQSVRDYQDVNMETIKDAIILLRKLANTNRLVIRPSDREVYHIRLTDFFKSREESRAYIAEFLEKITNNINIITDDEEIFLEELQKRKMLYKVNIIDTVNSSPWELIRKFSNYKKIHTNGSSLAFWGALLSGASLYTTDKKHHDLFVFLSKL